MLVKFPREHKESVIANIQEYFIIERSEEIGNIAAESLLDFMQKELEPLLYNQAISDARKLVAEKMMNLDEDLYVLEKSIRR